MGTRADFYVNHGDKLEWHGSIQWDGSPNRLPKELLQSSSTEEFLEQLTSFLNHRGDSIKPPTDKWPWVGDSSRCTDYAYIMQPEKGHVAISNFNSKTYTIYQYRTWLGRKRKAMEEGREIETLHDFIEKSGGSVPSFPNMRPDRVGQNTQDRRSSSSTEDRRSDRVQPRPIKSHSRNDHSHARGTRHRSRR